jgi:hypothetical protein
MKMKAFVVAALVFAICGLFEVKKIDAKKMLSEVEVVKSIIKVVIGELLDKFNRNLLYKYERAEVIREGGAGTNVTRTYTYPNGHLTTVKKLEYNSIGQLTKFQLIHHQLKTNDF